MGYRGWARWWVGWIVVRAVSTAAQPAAEERAQPAAEERAQPVAEERAQPVAEGPPAGADEPAALQGLHAWLRDTLQGAGPDPAAPAQRIYRYRRGGRQVFTNIAEQVPLAQRPGAAIDLSHIRLNSELGQRIDARLARAHAALTEEPGCQQARSQRGARPAWLHFYERHSAACLLAGALVLLLLITPAMVRRVDPLSWRRVLFFAIPALSSAALFSYSVDRSATWSERMLSASAAERCDPEGYRRLDAESAPLSVRLALVQTLQAQRAALDAIAADGRSSTRGSF